MQARLKALLDRLKAWWDKFTGKQKTLIISSAAGLLVAIAILATVLSRPQYLVIVNAETAKKASEVTAILADEGIPYQTSTDGLRVSVPKTDEGAARLALGANDILTETPNLDSVFSGGFTMTESDKQKRYVAYLEESMAVALKSNPAVKNAIVHINMPENKDLLITTKEEATASAMLELSGPLNADAASSMAQYMANALGNATTNHIVILDSESNMLFSGSDEYTVSGNASGQLKVQGEAEFLMNSKVKESVAGLRQFDDVTVKSNLSLDWSKVDKTDHLYFPNDGRQEGMLAEEYNYSAESSGSNGGIPGTDSNTQDPTYVYQDTSQNSSGTTENSRKYLPNETIQSTTTNGGAIQSAQSSIAVTLVKYKVIHEEDAKRDGSLADLNWAEYKKNNSDLVPLEVDDQLFDLVSKASGLPKENIQIIASQENMFFDAAGFPLKATDIVTILLILVILGLLAMVVWRTLRTQTQAEAEEISVEDLLSKQEPLEEIPSDERSEARKMIDKFVDENPEAVANLLRNWLQEEW